MFHYRGYLGRYVDDTYIGLVHGRVIGLRAVVGFAGATLGAARADFERKVDEHLERCRILGVPAGVPVEAG
jgi:predicted HicB family RNase H-like nuclease